jgi:hypothetical protein
VLQLPLSNLSVTAEVGDARRIPLPDASVDYIVTSPPYINVFNYHQNYRPMIEALGFLPLSAARAEIGANRKFRQNRFMTVIQYCMDMGLVFMELSRVLKEGKPLTIVLGRESNVRSVAFRNGELIAALALEGMGHILLDWNERKFLNRYGTVIFEDVMTILPNRVSEQDAVELGRAVGKQALVNSLEYCPKDRQEEITTAICSANTIEVSPHTKEI